MTSTTAAETVRTLIDELNATSFDNQEDHDAMSRRVDAGLAECKALWSNPADRTLYNSLHDDLLLAWSKAANR